MATYSFRVKCHHLMQLRGAAMSVPQFPVLWLTPSILVHLADQSETFTFYTALDSITIHRPLASKHSTSHYKHLHNHLLLFRGFIPPTLFHPLLLQYTASIPLTVTTYICTHTESSNIPLPQCSLLTWVYKKTPCKCLCVSRTSLKSLISWPTYCI